MMKNSIVLLMLLFFLTTFDFKRPLSVHAEELQFVHLSTEQGLSQNNVNDILQDRSGLLWVATDDGLNRYNGYEFTLFKHDSNDPQSLSDNETTTLFEDDEGLLWIGTEGGGLNVYDPRTETFSHFEHDAENPNSLSHDTVHAIFEDHEGMLWIGTEGGGLNRFDRKTQQFTNFQHNPDQPNSLSHNEVKSIYEDGTKTLWIGSFDGLNRFNRIQQNFSVFKNDPTDPHSIGANEVDAIFEDSSNTLWIGAEGGGLNRFDREQESFTTYHHDPQNPQSLGSGDISGILEDPQGGLWVGLEGGGLNLFDPQTEIFLPFKHDPNRPGSLSYDAVSVVFLDRSGVLWLGTEGQGLNRVDRKPKKFQLFRNKPDDSNSLSTPKVRSILEDRSGYLWVATEGGGLNRYDRHAQQVTHFRHDPEDPNSLSHDEVVALAEDQKGRLWIGTSGGGMDRFEASSQSFVHHQNDEEDPNSIIEDSIHTLTIDHSGFIWIGTEGEGLSRFDPQSDHFRHFQLDENDPNSLSHNEIVSIHEDQSQQLWIGTKGGGLNRFDPNTETFTRYQSIPGESNSLSDNKVWSIHEDRSGILWLGTGAGLDRLDPKNGELAHFTEKDGLPNSVIYGILEDSQGHLWLSTNQGLSRFSPQTQSFKNFDTYDGLQGQKFEQGAFHKSSQGEMFFGGVRGFNAFFPERIQLNQHIPPVKITDFQRFNESVKPGHNSILKTPILNTKTLELSHLDYIISFEFAVLDYSIPEKNQYAYKLEGFENQWNEVGTRRFATYTNLPAGNFVFRVKGSNNDGIWNETGASLAITVTPPFWKTWWAYATYAFAILTAIFAYVRTKTKAHAKEIQHQREKLEQQQQTNERLRQVDRLKDEFLANTSHELRTPLHGIIGLTESLIDGASGALNESMKANCTMIISSGKRLSTLINDILDFSTLKARTLEIQKAPVDMGSIVNIVLQLSQPLLAGKSVDLKNEIEKGTPLVEGDENRLQQIMHNLVGNAIKFTDTGTISVSVQRQDPFLKISVSDTGIGIPPDQLETIFQSFEQVDSSAARNYTGVGLGLNISKQLVELHGGEIWAESKLNVGSHFRFTLPMASGLSESLPTSFESSTNALESTPQEANVHPILPQIEVPKDAPHILVVDDEPINLQVLENYLMVNHYSVEKAESGQEALRALTQRKPDLVLLDVMMPQMSGYEACQTIRKTHSSNELPIIFLTAKNQVTDIVEGLGFGANDYLVKPFSKQELLARIETHVELSQVNIACGRFVPRQFLELLERKNITDLKLGDQVQKRMSVLFSDIRSFTTLSEKMSPEENFQFINSYLTKMGPLVRQNNGFIDKYIGDAIMALFEKDPKDAIQSAIDMQSILLDYNRGRQKAGYEPIRIGIGVNSGDLMLGTLGEEDRMEGTVIGDAVNLAARLEGLTKFFGASILISDYTLREIKTPQDYHHRFLGKVQVKGKKDVVSVYDFYGGETEESIQRKLETQANFELGLEEYFAHEFAEAAVCFKKVLQTHPEDSAAQLYLERSAQFMVQGVPEGWQGVESMMNK